MDRPPLDGKRILVTRPRHQSDAMADAIRRMGGSPIVLPLIRILPAEDTTELDTILRKGLRVNAVVFASSNAVHSVLKRCKALDLPRSLWQDIKVFAVGARTGESLRSHGLALAGSPEEYSGGDLAAMIAGADLRGQTYLFPRGDQGSEEVEEAVRAAGAETLSVVVYRTVGADEDTTTRLRTVVLSGGVDAVTFTSPSAIRSFCGMFNAREMETLGEGTTVCVIGGTTEQAARTHGLTVHVRAEESTGTGLVDALARYYQSQNSQPRLL